jgi:hypothetical protein
VAAFPNYTEKVKIACSCGETLRVSTISQTSANHYIELWDQLHRGHAEASLMQAQAVRHAFKERQARRRRQDRLSDQYKQSTEQAL